MPASYRARITRSPKGAFESLAVFEGSATVPSLRLVRDGKVARLVDVWDTRLIHGLPAEPVPLWVPLTTVLTTIRAAMDALYEMDEADAKAERDAELAAERYFENQGWYEAMAEREHEDSRGVIQFEDAMAMAYGRRG